MRFNEEEYAAFPSAAERRGLSNGIYAAQACMAHVRDLDSVEQEALRDLLGALILADRSGPESRRAIQPGGGQAERNRQAGGTVRCIRSGG
ncbi:hypothetical protein [Actinocorallia aurantiaca]|uniref:hypothetical protein n=1 Tax=Actinocorallia aurantiaca TaxID=46204 RepID=UPI0031D53634